MSQWRNRYTRTFEGRVGRPVRVQVPPTTFNFLEPSKLGSISAFKSFLRVPQSLISQGDGLLFSRACFAFSERPPRVPFNFSTLAENAFLSCSFNCLKYSNTGLSLTFTICLSSSISILSVIALLTVIGTVVFVKKESRR